MGIQFLVFPGVKVSPFLSGGNIFFPVVPQSLRDWSPWGDIFFPLVPQSLRDWSPWSPLSTSLPWSSKDFGYFGSSGPWLPPGLQGLHSRGPSVPEGLRDWSTSLPPSSKDFGDFGSSGPWLPPGLYYCWYIFCKVGKTVQSSLGSDRY